MLGGSAANFAVHTANLNRAGQFPIGDGKKLGGAAAVEAAEALDGVGGAAAAEAAPALAVAAEAVAEGGGGGGGGEAVESPVAGGGRVQEEAMPLLPRQSCVLHTSVGGDDMGGFVRKKLAEFGVDWSQAKERAHQGACVVLSGRADRSFVTHRGSTAEFCREDIDVPRLLDSNHVHVAGFYNCPALVKDLPGLLAEAHARGATCSLVPQWDASEEWGGLDELYPLLDVFMPNEIEALKIAGCTDVHEAAYFFIERGVGLVVVTRGDGGATAMSKGKRGGGGGRGTGREELGARDEEVGEGETVERDERWKWEQKCADVEVVDTTGAGDAFSAGFLHVWKATGDVQAALRWGCALGTTVVTRVGASLTLSVEEDIRPNLPP
eukprot:jgi/Undpi1/3683/HiC_scaffold_16.g07053.m1